MGIGTALINEMISQVRTNGVLSRIELSVLTNNTYAERLFRNAGFEAEGRRQGSIRINNVDFDEIMMVLKIGQE
jgi:ribosomal protein S18 acetylase RimI-like enzyme